MSEGGGRIACPKISEVEMHPVEAFVAPSSMALISTLLLYGLMAFVVLVLIMLWVQSIKDELRRTRGEQVSDRPNENGEGGE